MTFFWCLEATIGFNQREPDEEPALVNRKSPPQFELTGQDAKFLKSLRISVDDDSSCMLRFGGASRPALMFRFRCFCGVCPGCRIQSFYNLLLTPCFVRL